MCEGIWRIVCNCSTTCFDSDQPGSEAENVGNEAGLSPQPGDTWEGFLTKTETLAIGAGDFRLIGKFVKAATDEQESSSQDKRFRLSEAYAN